MIRIVLDTNQWLRLATGGTPSPLLRVWQEQKIEVVISEALLQELVEVLTRPNVERFLSYGRRQKLQELAYSRALLVMPASDTPLCRDPKDQIVLATAIGGHAQYIVTSDRDLLDDAALQKALAVYGITAILPTTVIKVFQP